MFDIKITDEGDFKFNHGKCELISDPDRIVQAIYMACKTGAGKWLASPNFGSDVDLYRGQVLTHSLAERLVASIKDALDRTDVLSDVTVDVKLIGVLRDTVLVDLIVEFMGSRRVLKYAIDPYNHLITREEPDTDSIIEAVRTDALISRIRE